MSVEGCFSIYRGISSGELGWRHAVYHICFHSSRDYNNAPPILKISDWGWQVRDRVPIPRNPEPSWVPRFRNPGFRKSRTRNPSGFTVPRNPGTRHSAGSPFLGNVVACYKKKGKLYPDTSVAENAQKRFFRRLPGSLENGTRRNGNPDTLNSDLDSFEIFMKWNLS
jgi:hypothetical protein